VYSANTTVLAAVNVKPIEQAVIERRAHLIESYS